LQKAKKNASLFSIAKAVHNCFCCA